MPEHRSADVVFEGGCLCGAIRYRATVAPVRVVVDDSLPHFPRNSDAVPTKALDDDVTQ